MRSEISKLYARLKAIEDRRQQGKAVSGVRCIREFIVSGVDPYYSTMGPPTKGTGDTCVRWLLFGEEIDYGKFQPIAVPN